ncbi:MAG: methyl-accepting chemotaxis protein [Clostridia bacterium]|nr:methyl-accepting chemotaxis protein [Clostridia bacterium]
MKWFYNLRLVVKISILSSVFILFILVLGVMGIGAVSRENDNLKSLNNGRLLPMYDLSEAKSHLMEIRLAVLTHVLNDDAGIKKQQEEFIAKNDQEYLEHIKVYKATYLVDAERNGLNTLENAYESYSSVRENVLKFSTEGKKEESLKLANSEGIAAFVKAVKVLDELINTQITEAEKLYTASEEEYDNIMRGFPTIISICLIMGIALSFITLKAIVGPVRKVTRRLDEIAHNGGDLTQRIGIDSKDEIGQLSKSFDQFVGSLQFIIRDVSLSAKTMLESSKQLSYASGESNKAMEQIAQVVNNIAGGTSDNVAVTEETTASLTEAARFSESTALISKKTNENSIKVMEAAEAGAQQVSEIAVSMKDIAGSSKEVAAVINNLNHSSIKIGEIVQLINNIAGQTNLLALNAAIEAARAGDAGKGFNVVAEEIRKLADESSRAAKDIVELIKENRIESENAVETVNEVDKMVGVCAEKAYEVKANIDNIINNIKNVTKQIGEINRDVEKQAIITEEITKAMGNIASNANDMAAGTEEMSASIEEQVGTMEELEATAHQLSEVADKLNKITSGFKA